MKISYGELLTLLPSFQYLTETCALPLPAAVIAVKNAGVIEGALKEYLEKEKQINEKYFKKDKNGQKLTRFGVFVFDEDKKEEYEKEIDGLKNTQTDLPLFKFDLKVLSGISIQPLHLERILPLFGKERN